MVKYFTLPALLLLYNTTCVASTFSEKLREEIRASQDKKQSSSFPTGLRSQVESSRYHLTEKPEPTSPIGIVESYRASSISASSSLTSPISSSIINWASIKRRQTTEQKATTQDSQASFSTLSQSDNSNSSTRLKRIHSVMLTAPDESFIEKERQTEQEKERKREQEELNQAKAHARSQVEAKGRDLPPDQARRNRELETIFQSIMFASPESKSLAQN